VAVSLLRTECRVDRHDERLRRSSQLLCEFAKNDGQVYRCLSQNLAWISPEHGIIDIATWYELDGLGFETQWGRGFPHPSKSALGPTQPAVERVLVLWRGGKSFGE
jgi:hypothetical protein